MAETEATSDLLDYLSYANMIDGTKELLTSDKWTFDVIPPPAVYFPGISFLQKHVVEISGLGMQPFQHNPIQGNMIRGFELPAQPGQIALKNTSITVTLVDYEDQSLYVMLADWSFKCCDPLTQKSYRASDLRGTCTYRRLDALNKEVRSYRQEHVIIGSVNYDDPFNGDKQAVGVNVTTEFIGILLPPTFANINIS